MLEGLRRVLAGTFPPVDPGEARLRLAAAGHDGEPERVRRWLAPGTGPSPELKAELERVVASLSERAEGLEEVALLGEALIALGRPRDALGLLEREDLPDSARLWRAEARFMTGALADAQRDLDEARPGVDPRSACLAAFTALLRGGGKSALEPLAAFLDAAPEEALAWGMRGFLAARLKDWPASAAALSRARALRPGAGWPLALSALVARWRLSLELVWRGGSGDRLPSDEPEYAALLADLGAALEREPAAWIFQLRAQYRELGGHMPGAIADLEEALRLSGPDPALLTQRGHCLFYVKRYEAAAADFTAALQTPPGSAALHWLRSQALWLGGRPAEAAADVAECLRLEPSSPTYRVARARFAVLLDPEEEALEKVRLLRRDPDPAVQSGSFYLEGLARFRGRRYAEAAEAFAEAERLAYASPNPVAFSELGFSRLARAFQFLSNQEPVMPKTDAAEKGTKPVLLILGLGLHYPHQATLEALRVLSECDVVYNNLAGAEAMEFLSLFCRDVRTVCYEGEDEDDWADRIFAELKPGTRAAFVTRGHPMVAGHLAQELLDRAAARGVEVKNYPAVSYLDNVLSLAGMATLETFWGLQVYDSRLVVEGRVALQTCLPVVLETGGGRQLSRADWVRKHATELAGKLRSLYPAAHTVYLYGPRYESRRMEPVRLEELEERLRRVDPEMFSSVAILVPPVENAVPAELEGSDWKAPA